jgi:hypothetical protein
MSLDRSCRRSEAGEEDDDDEDDFLFRLDLDEPDDSSSRLRTFLVHLRDARSRRTIPAPDPYAPARSTTADSRPDLGLSR